jgi:RNA-directed DNA polymerase
VISPLLANIYLHYVLDLWMVEWRSRAARGDVYIVRYADDFVVGFQHRDDAERCLAEMRARFARFGLELHSEKTRLIEFGRFASENRARRGEGKPETFAFLGFTHISGKRRSDGRFTVQRQSLAQRLRAKVKEVREWLMAHRHDPVPDMGRWLRSVVRGYFNYHAVPGNWQALETFRRETGRAWLWALRRRSQKGRHRSWGRIKRLIETWLPKARLHHPYPNVRFHARHPR